MIKNVKNDSVMIHNHEVGGSIPPLATQQKRLSDK